MNIQIAGRSDDVTQAMKTKAHEKVTKLLRFYERITWIDVVLDSDGVQKSAEISVGLNQGATLVGKAEGDDMHAAIDQAVDRVGRQVRKHKEKQQGHRPKPQDLSPEDVVPETAEPTFNQAVDEIDQGGN